MKSEAVTMQERGQARHAAPAPPREPRPGLFSRMPTRVLLAWIGLFAIAVVIVLSALARSDAALAALEEDEAAPTASARPAAVVTAPAAPIAPPKPPGAPPGALGAAGNDPVALAALADRYPTDPAVLKALFLAHAADKKGYAAALRAALKLLEAAPDRADDPDVQKALVLIASGPIDTAGAALELMAAKLGRRGPDLIYEVAQGFSPAKMRATALLKDPEVAKLASRELLFANELRETLPCARKGLVARAAAEGDERAVAQLKPLLNTQCGLFGRECYRCVTPADRKAIEDAIAAIEARLTASGRVAPHP